MAKRKTGNGKKAKPKASRRARPAKRSKAGSARLGGNGFTCAELAAFNKGHPKRRPAQFRYKRSYTTQFTGDLAAETVVIRSTRGRKPVSNSTSAAKVLKSGAAQARKRFTRKKSFDGKGSRYTARISLRWKSKSGKFVTRNLSATADSMDRAMELLLANELLNSNTYERWDEENQETYLDEIGGKNKRIVGVSFDKYIARKRKVSKAAKSKKRK